MAKLKFHITKAGLSNPKTKEPGFIARVITNGIADFDEIAETACHNTTMHKAELKMAFELGMEAVAERLMQGYIVDLGPVGRLYPSCNSKWVAASDDLKLANIRPAVHYRAASDLASAVHSARLMWAEQDNSAEEKDDEAEKANL